ncbi:MAG: GYD domain-containing protein [Gemmatimonadales bacterium]
MPIYLWHASYTADGTKGPLKDGGSKRRATVQQMIQNAGGKLHAFYYAFGEADVYGIYAFGEADVYGIAEFPDQATAAALSLAANATGAVDLRTTVLITPEEMDAAAKKSVTYRPPGA